jgi:Ion channel
MSTSPRPERPVGREGGYRYGAVLMLTLTVVLVVIGAPNSDWSRALALGLELAALIVVIVSSRERAAVRKARALVVSVIAAATVIGIAVGVIPSVATFVLAAALSLLIPLTLFGGLLRLMRAKGVTVQVVAGALAIYLLIGLVFASAIGVLTYLGSSPFFAQGTNGTPGDRVYYSFTVMTTTGFGDFTARQPVGRALAVLEMLIGQLYLVTVIGILVGNMSRQRRSD